VSAFVAAGGHFVTKIQCVKAGEIGFFAKVSFGFQQKPVLFLQIILFAVFALNASFLRFESDQQTTKRSCRTHIFPVEWLEFFWILV